MRDRKDSRNLPFYIRSEILKNRKEMLREMRKSVKLKESKKKQLCKESEEETTLEIKSL